MDIVDLQNRAYEIASKHGWYDKKVSAAHELMMIMSEVFEILQAEKKGLHADLASYKKLSDGQDFSPVLFERYIKDSVEDEFADVVIRSLSAAAYVGVSYVAEEFTEEKIQTAVEMTTNRRKEVNAPISTLAEELFGVVHELSAIDECNLDYVVFIVCVIARLYDIDIEWHICEKMKYNETRPFLHGHKA